MGYHPAYPHPAYAGQPVYYHHPMAYYSQPIQYCFGQPQQMQPIAHIPHYARMEQPVRPANSVVVQQAPAPIQQQNTYVINAPFQPSTYQSQSSQIQNNRSEHNNSEKLDSPKYEITKLSDLEEDPDLIRVTLYTKDHKHEEDEPSIVEYTHRQDQFGAYDPSKFVNYEQNNY